MMLSTQDNVSEVRSTIHIKLNQQVKNIESHNLIGSEKEESNLNLIVKLKEKFNITRNTSL